MYRLVIVDDEQLERQAITYIVKSRCPELHVVGEAQNGEEAVSVVLTEKPDIVLMDIKMPGMDGLEAMKVIASNLPDTIIVILTAFDEFDYAKQAVKLGACDYLLKPIRPDELVNVLIQLLGIIEKNRKKKERENMLRKQLEQALPFIKMSLVYDLVLGHIDLEEEAVQRAAFLGLDFNHVAVMVVNIDHFLGLTRQADESEKQMLKQKVFRCICQELNGQALVTPFSGDKMVAIVNVMAETDGDERVIKIAERVRSKVAEDLGFTVTIGVGRCYRHLIDAAKSYLEAISAQDQSFYLGQNQVISIQYVPHLKANRLFFPISSERAVFEKVRCGERDMAKTALEKLLVELSAACVEIDAVKVYALELLAVLSRCAVEGGARVEQLPILGVDSIAELRECRSFEDIRQWLFSALDKLFDSMLVERQSINRRLINKACEMIKKKFTTDISLEDTAQYVHLSTYYFSRVFKQETNLNFVDYLTRLRMDKAKELLENTDMNVVQISDVVGYRDASYFCRVFRRESGLTPNQYRKKVIQRQ